MNTIISTENAPEAIGAYSQAIKIDNFIFLSGQIPMGPTNGKIAGNSIEEKAKQVLDNVQAILKEAGLKMNNVVKATVYLDDMENFAQVNEIYKRYFSSNSLPARAVVEVSRLPKEVLIEIAVIAHE